MLGKPCRLGEKTANELLYRVLGRSLNLPGDTMAGVTAYVASRGSVTSRWHPLLPVLTPNLPLLLLLLPRLLTLTLSLTPILTLTLSLTFTRTLILTLTRSLTPALALTLKLQAIRLTSPAADIRRVPPCDGPSVTVVVAVLIAAVVIRRKNR